MRARHRSAEIDLRRTSIPPDLEVLDGSAVAPAPEPRPRIFAELDELPEPAYLRGEDDGIGSAGLWKALESL